MKMTDYVSCLLVLSAIIGAISVTGCGNEQGVHEDLVAPKKITSKTGPLLKPLFDSSNRIVKNNAKVAVNALENDEYVKAVGSMQTIDTLKRLPREDRNTLNRAFKRLETELQSAAKEGDKEAKTALKLIGAP